MFSDAPQEMLHEMYGALNALDIVSEASDKDHKIRLESYLKILIETSVLFAVVIAVVVG